MTSWIQTLSKALRASSVSGPLLDRGRLRSSPGRVEDSGPDSGGWGQLKSHCLQWKEPWSRLTFPLFLWHCCGGQGFLRAGPACQGHREPSPVLASSRKQHVFISQVLLGSVCRLGCTWAQGPPGDITSPPVSVMGTQHTTYTHNHSTGCSPDW